MNKDSVVLTVGKRGVLTMPKEFRETYQLEAGDQVSMMDLGGFFLLSPKRSEIDALADRVASSLGGRGGSLEGMLKVVREERERYGRRK